LIRPNPANLHGHVLKAFSDVVASNALNNRILRRQAKWPTEMVRLFIRPNPAKHKLHAPDSRIPPHHRLPPLPATSSRLGYKEPTTNPSNTSLPLPLHRVRSSCVGTPKLRASRPAIQKALAQLKLKGLVRQSGRTRDASYTLVENAPGR